MNKKEIISRLDIRTFYKSVIPSLTGGIQASACCPFPNHEDGNPSFSVNLDTGIFNCHGCGQNGNVFTFYQKLKGVDFPTALRRLAKISGVSEKALSTNSYGTKTAKTSNKINATYGFTDENGKLLFQEVRYEPKDFLQRRPDGNGKWIYNLKGVALVLYNLPQVKDATEVFIVEGPKDAEALRSLGYVATCNPMGAGKWKPEYSTALRGKSVFIIPDNDTPGHKHATDVARSLKGVECIVKLIVLPDLGEIRKKHGLDISDWVELKHKEGTGDKEIKAKIERLAEETLEWASLENKIADSDTDRRFKLVLAGDIEAKPPQWIVRGLLEKDALALVFGDPGCGKSFWALDLALCVATGAPHHGHKVDKGPVVYIAGEGQNGMKRRLMGWSEVHGVEHEDAPLYISPMATALTEQEELKEVHAAIDKAAETSGSPVLVVIDTVARNFGPADENSTSDMSRFIQAADSIRTRYNLTVLLVHHSGHGDKSRARGAIALKGALDAEYKMDKDENDTIRLEATKMKEAEHPAPFAFKLKRVNLPLKDEETGEVITSAALELTNYEPRSKKGKQGRGKHQVIALETLNDLLIAKQNTDGGNVRISLDEWKQAAKGNGVPTKQIGNVMQTLIKVGSVWESQGFVVLVM